VRRVFHPVAVHFKGSGFYTTDYARDNDKGPDESKAKTGSEDSSKGSSESSTDSSKAAGSESKAKAGSSDSKPSKPKSS
jgi:predicted nucleic acid-binding Zn ribbon protein